MAAGVGATINLTQEDRLSHELHFPAAKPVEVCELAGARRQRKLSEEAKVKQGERLKAYRFMAPGTVIQPEQRANGPQ